MPQRSTPTSALPGARPLALAALSLASLLAACGGGGGGGDSGGSTASTGFTSGAISGFGSVIVNGIRYDDSSSSVFDDEGSRLNRGSDDPLKLGVVVEVSGRISDDGLSGTASGFTVRTEMKGPIEAKNSAAGTITVLGTVVNITATTLFQGVAGFAGLVAGANGQVVEVYGLPGANGQITATRIELEAANVASFSGDYRIRGRVANLAGTAPNQTFQVGALAISTGSGTRVDGSLANGNAVSVRLNKTPVAGVYTATRVQQKNRGFSDSAIARAEVEGLVTAFTSVTNFEVNGYPVRTDASTRFEDGTAGIVLGARVEAEGRVENGVLLARKVEIDDFDDDQRDSNDSTRAPFEFKGVPSAVAAGSLTLRGQTIALDASTVYSDGLTATTLAGVNLEVKAVASGSSGGLTTFRAVRIERDN